MRFIALYCLILSLVICVAASLPSEALMWNARADIHANSDPMPMGTLFFSQMDVLDSPVRVTGVLFNLKPNTRYHGFHVHEFPTPDGEWSCTKAGDHWNPLGTPHGDRYDAMEQRHVGDLGNIWADEIGNAIIDFEDSVIQVHPESMNSILRKSIVVHDDIDDLGRGLFNDSRVNGHSGARIACGNIRMADKGPNRGNYRHPLRRRPPFLPRHCPCLTIDGRCVPDGTYQCSTTPPLISIVQCVGRNQWVSVTNCPFSCELGANAQPYCI